MWKGVKGVWNVLKSRDRHPSLREDIDNEVPAIWIDDDVAQSNNGDEEIMNDVST